MQDDDTAQGGGRETATLGGGCFWCLEAVFERLKGVVSVTSGYMGGNKPNPVYEEVCSGRTGHAEVVRIVYEPAIVSFREILEVFFATHDPTTSNRQGNDIGTQYRSSVFYQDSRQKQAADETIAELTEAAVWKDPIVTEVVPAGEFYPAEEYHQQYFARNPYQPYCQFIVAPKLAKFREYFVGKLKSK